MNPKNILTTVDPELINIHMRAAAKRGDRRKALEALHMERKDETLHIITTNGALLLHTAIPTFLISEGSEEDFKLNILITGKLRKASVAFVEKHDDIVIFYTPEPHAFALLDGTYPNVASCEDVATPEGLEMPYKSFTPQYLAIIHAYIGADAYPYPQKTGLYQPNIWRQTTKDGIKKTAVLMPIRPLN